MDKVASPGRKWPKETSVSKFSKLAGHWPLLIAAGLVAVLTCLLLPARIENPPGSVPLALAREKCKLPLPDSARDIRFASYRRWPKYAMYLRFSAPASDCERFAQGVLEDWRLSHAEGNPQPAPLTELIDFPAPLIEPRLDVKWFDIQNLEGGKVAGGGGPGKPWIWIDTHRNLCYYWIKD